MDSAQVVDLEESGEEGSNKPERKTSKTSVVTTPPDDGAANIIAHLLRNCHLCSQLQQGNCKSKWLDKQNCYDNVCPVSKDFRHQCNICLSRDHSPKYCNGAAPAAPYKKQKKGGGKK